MTEQNCHNRNGDMDRLFRWSMVLMGVALFVTALSHISFLVSGDAAIYIEQWNTLRQDYLDQNLSAWMDRWQGMPATYMRLRTEGGFAFLLWLVGMLHPLLPFILNAFFAAAVVALAAILAVVFQDRTNRGPFSAWLFIILLFSQGGLTDLIWNLARPMRDMPAHFWGLAGLLACAWAVRKIPVRHGLAFLGGLCVGLAAWTRVPNVLFIVPAGMTLLLTPLRLGFKRRVLLLLGLGVGCMCGLLPLAAQNIVEGKSLLAPGQAKVLVSNQPASITPNDANEDEPSQAHGLHLVNFSETFRSALVKSSALLDGWFLALAAGALLAGLLLTPARMLVLLSGGLSFFVFYAFYHRVVFRYLFPSYLFLALLAALPLGSLLDIVLDRLSTGKQGGLRDQPAGNFKILVLALLILAGFILCAFQLQPPSRFRESYRDTAAFRAWMDTAFQSSDIFISNRQGIKAWLDAFGPRGSQQMIWNRGNVADAPPRKIAALLNQDRRVFFLTFSNRHQCVTSWWLDDLQNDFQAIPLEENLELRQWPVIIIGHQILRRDHEVSLAWPPATINTTNWFVFVRTLSVTGRYQSITVADGTQTMQVALQAGPNVLPLAIGANGASIRLTSADPLPSLLGIQPAGPKAIRIPLDDYSTFFSFCRMVQPARSIMRGYEQWSRDWGGDGIERHESHPALFLEDGSLIRMPAHTRPFEVRLLLTIYADRHLTRGSFKEAFRLECGGTRLIPEYEIHESDFAENGGGMFTITMKAILPPAGSRTPDVLCRIASDDTLAIRLDRLDLGPFE